MSFTLTPLEQEAWLAKRLAQHGARVFTGDTNPQIRRDRVRGVIVAGGLAAVIVGQHEDKPETYAQVFERVYGEKL